MLSLNTILSAVVLVAIAIGSAFVGGCVHGVRTVDVTKALEKGREIGYDAGKVAGRAEGWRDGYKRGQADKCGTNPDDVTPPDDKKPWWPFGEDSHSSTPRVRPKPQQTEPTPADKPPAIEPIDMGQRETINRAKIGGWIDEAIITPAEAVTQLTPGQLLAIYEAHSDEVLEVWATMPRTATMREAVLEWLRLNDIVAVEVGEKPSQRDNL